MAGGLPTAFRAADRDELLPTFKRLKDKHPDAELKFFARGKLWASSEDAEQDAAARRADGRRPSAGRGRDWRPGGEHVDPRQKYKDAKKDRNLDWRKQRFERRERASEHARPTDQSTAPADRKPFGGPPRDGPPRDRQPYGGPPRDGPPRDRRPFGGPPRDGPPRDRQPYGGPPRDGPPRDRRPYGGPPRDGPPRNRKPFGGPPRDGPPRPFRPAGGRPRDPRRRS